MLSTEVYDRRINQVSPRFPNDQITHILSYAARHGLRCKSIDGQWHFYKDGDQWNDHIQAYKQPAYSHVAPRKSQAWRKHISKMAPACEVCGTWVATREAYGLQICNWPECENDAAYTYESQERKATVTKFKVGDKVQLVDKKDWRAKVVEVKTAYTLKHEGGITPSSAVWFDEELEPATVKLTPEEAWAEVGAMIMDSLHSDPFLEPTVLRHRAYEILGGNDVPVGRPNTELHERVKSRLNGLIDRFVKKYLTESRPFGGG